MRKLNQREKVLLGAVGVAVVLLVVARVARRTPSTSPAAARGPAADAGPPIPRIDLARLGGLRSETQAGRRNLFEFGSIPREEPEEPIIVPTPRPSPRPGSPGGTPLADATPAAPSLPPLNVKYIGSVESASGVKAAVLITDRKEVLTGATGELVANRYRISRIGLESVDLEDVSNGQSRRIPLRAQ